MEGGQKHDIPLDSGLDVKSSDQLVPVGSPLFQHNRQLFQGSMLPTSLRYEHDGWACGWDVYEFEADTVAVNTEPEGYTVIRTKLNDNPTYIFQVRSGTSTYARIWYNAEDSDRTGGLSIAHDSSSFHVVTVSGECGGDVFELRIDMLTGEIEYDDSLWSVAERSYFDATSSGGLTQLNVTNLESWVSFNAAVLPADDVRYNGSSIASYYSCGDGSHLWKSGSDGSWSVEYLEADGSVSVNGESAAVSRDGPLLSIGYDTSYDGSLEVSAQCEEFYFQISDVFLKQNSSYVSASNPTTEAFGSWSVSMSGDSYLCPTDASSPSAAISASVPFWCGVSLKHTMKPSASTLSIQAAGNPAGDSYGIMLCTVYLLTSSALALYDDDVAGASGQFWIGSTECLSEYGELTTSASSRGDISPTLTLCACVFNRIALVDESVSTYGVPVRAGSAEGSDVETEENAPWLDAFEAENAEGDVAAFEAGFYHAVAYHDGGELEGAEYDAGWYLSDSDGAARPDLYPDAYPEDMIAVSVAAGDEEYSNIVRLDAPYAFYDIGVEGDAWSGSRYEGYVSSSKEAAQSSVDVTLELRMTEYRDSSTQKVYSLGGAGYVLPYFIASSDSGTDTRDLDGYVSGTDESSIGRSTISFSSGPLAGWKVSTLVSTSILGTYKSGSTFGGLTESEAASAAKEWISSKSETLVSQGYAIYSSSYTITPIPITHSAGNVTWVTASFYFSAVVYTASFSSTAYLYKNGSVVWSTSSDVSKSLDSILGSFGIAPVYAGISVEGCSSGTSTQMDQVSVILSLCYSGKLDYVLKMDNTSGNGTFTSSDALGCISLSPSSYVSVSNCFLLDRDAQTLSGSESGGNLSCTMFGVNVIGLAKASMTVSGGSATLYLYVKPANGASVYAYSGSDADVYIPGNVYYGSSSYVLQGLNLSGSLLGSSYNSSDLTFYVKGDVASFYRMSSVSMLWSAESGVHDFYSECLPYAVAGASAGNPFTGSAVGQTNGYASASQTVEVFVGGSSVMLQADYVLSEGEASTAVEMLGGSESLEYMGYAFMFSVSGYSLDGIVGSMYLAVSVPLHYALEAVLPCQYNYASGFLYDEASGKYEVDGEEHESFPVGSLAVSYDNSTQDYSFESDGGYTYKYNASSEEISYGSDVYETEAAGDARTAEISSLEQASISFTLQGAYAASSGAEIVSFGEDSITFSYSGQEYSFPLSALMSDSSTSRLAFMYTDTTDGSAVPKSVTFAVQDTDGEYQFLRQAWNTLIEVENYWWIDESTILELNKTSLVVKRKVSSLDCYDEDTDVDVDDWGGDAWRDVCSFDRGDYIDNTVARYGATCAYGGASARFWTVKLASSYAIRISFYELKRESDFSYSFEKSSVSVQVNTVSIGKQLNASEGKLNTYSQLSAKTIIYEAKYSGTVIGEHILFGIHLDNNFNQWALDILETGELNAVVQGYGWVGLDGSLTGGEIPSAYFDAASGFSGTVLPIDEIEQDDVEYVDSMSAFTALDAEGKVIGDESQQWYITKSLYGIVSHLTWNGDSWDAVSLPITNNYSCCYGSPSYGKRLLSDKSFWARGLTDLVSDSTFKSAISSLTNMINAKVYGYSPKVTTAMYLQQTMGQYAYVHYNSMSPGKQKDLSREDTSENAIGEHGVQGTSYTQIGVAKRKKEEPIDAVSPESSDDFSFNLHGIRQNISITKPWSGDFGIMMVIMCGMSSLTSALSGVFDTVKVNAKNGQVSVSDSGRKFSQIFLENMDNLASMGFSVIGVLPDMQSAVGSACTLDMFYSTSEGQQVLAGPGWVQHNMIAQCVAQSVTSCQWEMQQIGMLWLVEGISSIAAKVAYEVAKIAWDVAVETANSTKEGTAAFTNYGWVGAVAIIAVAAIAYGACAYAKLSAEATDALIKSICGGSAKVEVQNASSKHTYDVEGKHKYGQKSEVFMWPCFGVESELSYTDEYASPVLAEHNWNLHVPLVSGQSWMGGSAETLGTITLEGALGSRRQDDGVISSFEGDIIYQIANCKGATASRTLPSDMAAVIGADSFLPPVPFRNENIGMSPVSFPTPCFQDYIIDKDWELSRTAGSGWTTWISCKDTKLIDGDASNIVLSDDFCGVAAPYTAIEVKRGFDIKYLRPWAITPNALALNQTGYNCCYDRKAYHAFDGYGQRIVKWCGAAGMNKEGLAYQYAFIVNDRLKRSNRIFRNEFMGNFSGDPVIALATTGDDWVYNHVTWPGKEADSMGVESGCVGEDKDVTRYSVPVFSELVSTLPAVVKTISSINLSVIDGITSLTTDNRDLQSAYKAPISVDFAIGKDKYRFTEEYISQLEVDAVAGVTTLTDVVPTLGLEFLGATPYEAYLYSQATRKYYSYSGGPRLEAVDTLERFRDVLFGRYDFVNQEVALPCVATFDRLDKHVHDDDDERDNVIVPRMRNGAFAGEVSPPVGTIYNMRSGFRTISLPSGLCYQGPNRCIISRFVYSGYMGAQIVENYGKWKRVPRERYHPFRDYGVEYERVDEPVDSDVIGWTHNPFLLVTSPLGVNSETDCVFEWEITFAWPVEMDELYAQGQYATVNIMGECFAPGGKAIPDRPAHVFLWKDLFTRTGNYGYYSFRYQSRCGAGNRERLHIWSDQYIAISGLQADVKPVTEKRTEVLTQQADVMEMEEI